MESNGQEIFPSFRVNDELTMDLPSGQDLSPSQSSRDLMAFRVAGERPTESFVSFVRLWLGGGDGWSLPIRLDETASEVTYFEQNPTQHVQLDLGLTQNIFFGLVIHSVVCLNPQISSEKQF